MSIESFKTAIARLANPASAEAKSRYFRTGAGEYGEGDRFIGVTVPQVRVLVKQFWHKLTVAECELILCTGCHEERLFALLVMVKQFEKGTAEKLAELFTSYLKHRRYVNNWDLVDSSAFQIVGAYLRDHPSDLLDQLAQSQSLWDRRISIIATFAYIKKGETEPSLRIAALLLNDKEDLIHKAVGWLIREVELIDSVEARTFLKSRYTTMPRTMLRYAIEKFPEAERLAWLKGTIGSTEKS